MDPRTWLTNRILGFLTEPRPGEEPRAWNDLDALLRHARKGDVLLVCGDTRAASIIKYLTQSCWSHAGLYVGDELLRRGGATADAARQRHGHAAASLLIEALPEGVHAAPVAKYLDYPIRLVRPHRLRPDHLKKILDAAVASLGWTYDLRNIVDLLRYLLPVRIVPQRLRRTALHFGSGAPTEVICSSLLGQLYHSVGFPIMPAIQYPDGFDARQPRALWHPGVHLLRRFFGHESPAYTGLFHMRHPTLLTPRDFDLSPYFEIVKFNVIADGSFDYNRIHWADAIAEGEHPRPYGAIPPESEAEPPLGPAAAPDAPEPRTPAVAEAAVPPESAQSPRRSARRPGRWGRGSNGEQTR